MSLCIPVCHDSFVVETDASGTGVGGVLLVRRDGQLCPVSFYSAQLQGAKKNYSSQTWKNWHW